MTLYLARHGQTEWNHSARIQGREDIPLNDTGRLQAQGLGEGLRELGIERIWSSPLSRAQETARTIASICHIDSPITLFEGLTERDFGASGGMTVPERSARWPDEETVTGQESFPALQTRALAALEHILRMEKASTILAVSHGAFIDAIIRHFTNTPFEGIASIRLRNCSVTRLDAQGPEEGFRLVWSNRIAGEFLLSDEEAARAQEGLQGVLR